MTLYKRFYNVFVTGIIDKIVLPDWRYDSKWSFALNEDSACLKVLHDFTWSPLAVFEKGENRRTRSQYFKKKKKGLMSWSKMIRINRTDVYVIGGDKTYPSLLTREYDVACSCLKINIITGEISQKAKMLTGRSHFGLANIGHFLYVVGGQDTVL